MKPYIHVRYLAQVFLECEIFLTKAVGKIKTHFTFNNFLSKIMPFMRKCRKMLYSWKGHRCQYNTACVLRKLRNYGYKHTLIICNTYCFSMAIMVTWMCLNITLHVHGLSCKSDMWLTVHRNSVWIRNQLDVIYVLSFISPLQVAQHVSGNHVPIFRRWWPRSVIVTCWYCAMAAGRLSVHWGVRSTTYYKLLKGHTTC
jgi:hypothetical protein